MKETRVKLDDSDARDGIAIMHASWNTVAVSPLLTPAQVMISADGSSTGHGEEVKKLQITAQSFDSEYGSIQADDVLDHSDTDTSPDTSNDPSTETAETNNNKAGSPAGIVPVNSSSKDSGFNRNGLIEEEDAKSRFKLQGSRVETSAGDKTSSLLSFNASETQMWSEDTTDNEDPAYQVYEQSGILNDFAGYFIPSFLTDEKGMRAGHPPPELTGRIPFVQVHNINEQPRLFSSEEPAKATIVPSMKPAPRTIPSPIPLTFKLVNATTNHLERAYSAVMSTLFPHETSRGGRKPRRSSSNIHSSKPSSRTILHSSGSDSDVNRSKRIKNTSVISGKGLLGSIIEMWNPPRSQPGSKRSKSKMGVANTTSEIKSPSPKGSENPSVEETKKVEQNHQDIAQTTRTDQTENVQRETRKNNFTFGKTSKKTPSHSQKFVGPSKTWRTITNSQYIATTARKNNLNLKFGLATKSLANMNVLANHESSSLISEGSTNLQSPGNSTTHLESVSAANIQELLDTDLDSVGVELQSPPFPESKNKVSPPKEDVISPKAIPRNRSKDAKSCSNTPGRKNNRLSPGVLTKNHKNARNLGSNNQGSYDKSPVGKTGVSPGPVTVTSSITRTKRRQARSPTLSIKGNKAAKSLASPMQTLATTRSHPRRSSTSSSFTDVLRIDDSGHQKTMFHQKISKPVTIETLHESFNVKSKPCEATADKQQKKSSDLNSKKATNAPALKSPLIFQVADPGSPESTKDHLPTISAHLAGSLQDKVKTANWSRVPVQKASFSSTDTLGRVSWASSPELQKFEDVTDFLSTSDPGLDTGRSENADIYYCINPTCAGDIPESSSKFREKYYGNKCYTSNVYYTNSRNKKITALQDRQSTHELEDAVLSHFSESSRVVNSSSISCSIEDSDTRQTDILNDSYTTHDYKDGRKETQAQSHLSSFFVLASGDQQQEMVTPHQSQRCTPQKSDSEIGHGPSLSGQCRELLLLAKVHGDHCQRGDAGREFSRGRWIDETDRGLYLEESCDCRHVKHFQQGPFATEGREIWQKRNAQRQEIQREGQTGGHNLDKTGSPYLSPKSRLSYLNRPSVDRMTAVSTQEFYKKRGNSTGLLQDMAKMIEEHQVTSTYGSGGLQTGQPEERYSTPRSGDKMDTYRDDTQIEDNPQTETSTSLNEGKQQETRRLPGPPGDESVLVEKTNGCPNLDKDCLIGQSDMKTEKLLSILLEISQETIDNRNGQILADNMPAKLKVSLATKPPESNCSLDIIQHQDSLHNEHNTNHRITESLLESQSFPVEDSVDGASHKRCDRSVADAEKDVVPAHVSTVRGGAKFDDGKHNCEESKQLRVQIALSDNVSEDSADASASIGNSQKPEENSSCSTRHSTNNANLEKETDSVNRSSTPEKAADSVYISSSSDQVRDAGNSPSDDQLSGTSDTMQVTSLSLLSEDFACSKDLTSKSNVVFSIFREVGPFKTEQCTFQPNVHDSRSHNNDVREESSHRRAVSFESGRRAVCEVAGENSSSDSTEVTEPTETSSYSDQLSGDGNTFGKDTSSNLDSSRERSGQLLHSWVKRETNSLHSDLTSPKVLNSSAGEKQDKRPKKVVTFRDTEEKERSDRFFAYSRETEHRKEDIFLECEMKLDGERAWSNLKRNYKESTLSQYPLDILPNLAEGDGRCSENTIKAKEITIRTKPRTSGRSSPTENVNASLSRNARRSDQPVHAKSVLKAETESAGIVSESTKSVFDSCHVKYSQATDQRSNLNRTRRPEASPPRPHTTAARPLQAHVVDRNKSSTCAEPLHRRLSYIEPHIHKLVPRANKDTSPTLNGATVGTTRDASRGNTVPQLSPLSAARYVPRPTPKIRNQSGLGDHFSQQTSGFQVSVQQSKAKPQVPSYIKSPVPSPRIESGFKNFTPRPDQKKEGVVRDRHHKGVQDVTKVPRRDLNEKTTRSPQYWNLAARDGTNPRWQVRSEAPSVSSQHRLRSASGSPDSLHQQRSSERIDVGVRRKNSPVHDYINLNRTHATLRNVTSHQREISREQEMALSNFQKDSARNTKYNLRSDSRLSFPESRTRAQPLKTSSSRSPLVSIGPTLASSKTRTARVETAYGGAPSIGSNRRAIITSPRGDGVSEPSTSRSFDFLDIYDDSLTSVGGRNDQNQERYRPGISTNNKKLMNRQSQWMTPNASVQNKEHRDNKTAIKVYTEAAMRYSSYSLDEYPNGGFFIPEVDNKEDSRTKNMKLLYSSSEYPYGRSSDVRQKHSNDDAARNSNRNINIRPVQRQTPLGDISRKRDGEYELTKDSDDEITFKSPQTSEQRVLISKLNSTAAQSEIAKSFAKRCQYQAGSSLADVDDSLAYYKNRSAKRKTQDLDKQREKGSTSRHQESQSKGTITSPQSHGDAEYGASHDSTRQRKLARPRTTEVGETGQVPTTSNLMSRGDVAVVDRVTAQDQMNSLTRANSQTVNKLLLRANSSGGLASARLISAEHEVQTYRSGLRHAWRGTAGRSDKMEWSDKLGWSDKVGSGEGFELTVDRRGLDQKSKMEDDNGGRISAKNQPRKNHSPKMVSEVKEIRMDYHRNVSSNSGNGFFRAQGAVSLSHSRSSTSV